MANKAACLTGPKVKPYEVFEVPMPVPDDNEIVIHNKAVAINPVDWGVQNMGIMNPDYPLIGGSDAAGEIAAVGSAIKKFKVGDRVVALVGAYHNEKQDNSRGAFQLFSKTDENSVAKISDNISFAEASVLPLCFSVAASGLFGSTTLGLKPVPYINPKPTGKVILIWGGSSSVGACAIQLAIGAGYEVATTAGSLNLDYCTSLGAKYVFDRSKSTVVEDVVTGLKNQDFGGAFCAGTFASEAIQQCGQIAHQLGGHKFVSTVKAPQMPLEQGLPDGVGQSAVWGPSILQEEPSVWGEWLPTALATGAMKCAPPPAIFGQNLEAIQGAVDRCGRQTMSCRKVVVELSDK